MHARARDIKFGLYIMIVYLLRPKNRHTGPTGTEMTQICVISQSDYGIK